MNQYAAALIRNPAYPMYQCLLSLIRDLDFCFKHIGAALDIEILEVSGNIDAFRS